MNNSILNKISNHEKMNNIGATGLYFNFSNSFPTAFYKTVINYLESANTFYDNEKPIYDFYIGFDDNNNAYFEFVGRDNETRVIVVQDDIEYNIEFPPSMIIKESMFLENVSNLDAEENKAIMDYLPKNFIERFIKDESEIKSIEIFFDELANQIIDYISYLENEIEINEDGFIEKLYFTESEASKNAPRTRTGISKPSVPRRNVKIPFEERKEALDSYEASDTFEARATNTSSVYYVKVFKIKEKCKLVMEPIEGNKYTKVFHLDSDKISKGTVREIVIDTLQLSRNETTDTKEITRHTHTTLEEYKKLLEYLINSNSSNLHPETLKRIDDAGDTKIR